MGTGKNLFILLILSIGILTASTLLTSGYGVTPAFAKKKHCDKQDNRCDTITSTNRQYLLGGNETSTSGQADLGQNDSNNVDEPTTLDNSKTSIDNSKSSNTNLSGNPFQ